VGLWKLISGLGKSKREEGKMNHFMWRVFSAALIVMMGFQFSACGDAVVTRYNAATSEVKGFQSTVYKLVRENTCVGCHADAQTPFFAHEDPNIAYEAIMSSKKVNFQKPELSRMYLRLSADKHNCWYNNDCAASAKEMLDAIYEWRKSVEDYGANFGELTEEKPFLKNGLPPLPAGGFIFEAESAKVILAKKSLSGNKIEMGLDSAANGGKYLHVSERGRVTPVAALGDFTNYSHVRFSFDAPATTYRFFARVSGAGRFNLKLNNDAPGVLDTGNSANWNWA
jgi:hypothetical protein